MTNLERLEAWCEEHQQTHYLEAIYFFPGPDGNDIEEMAGIAMDLLTGWDTGEEVTEN